MYLKVTFGDGAEGAYSVNAGSTIQVVEESGVTASFSLGGVQTIELSQDEVPVVAESEPTVAATPAAVAAAEEHGVDLTAVEGSGADGKVLVADVVAAAAPAEPAVE